MRLFNFIFLLLLQHFISSLDLFVSNSSTCPTSCDGTYLNPFSGLLSAFASLSTINTSSLTLHLLDSTYILGSILTSPQVYNVSFAYFKMKPISCSNETLDCQWNVSIRMKSPAVKLLLSNQIVMQNLIWIGTDLVYNTLNNKTCSFQYCCQTSDIFNPNSSDCYIYGADLTKLPILQSGDISTGLMSFQGNNVSLTLTNNEFIDFIAIRSHNSNILTYDFLIGGANIQGSQLYLLNTSFRNSYLNYGLVFLPGKGNFLSVEEVEVEQYNGLGLIQIENGYNGAFIILGSSSQLNMTRSLFWQNGRHFWIGSSNYVLITNLSIDTDFSSNVTTYFSLLRLDSNNSISIYNLTLRNITFSQNSSLASQILSTDTFTFQQNSMLFNGNAGNNLVILGLQGQGITNVGLFNFGNQSIITLNDSYFENITLENGVFIELQSYCFLSITNSTFIGQNSPNFATPFILLSLVNTIQMTSCFFVNLNNTVLIFGNDNQTISLSNTTFSTVLCQDYSTIINLHDFSTITIKNSSFTDITSGKSQGGLFNVNDYGYIIVLDTLIQNVLGNEGGIFYIMDYNQLWMQRSQVISSQALLAVLIYGRQNNNTMIFEECEFRNTSSVVVSQIFYGVIKINLCVFSNLNFKGQNAGVLLGLNSDVICQISNSSITDVFSQGSGGALDAVIDCQISISQTSFTNLYLVSGSIATLGNENLLIATSCAFQNVVSTSFGGLFALQTSNTLQISSGTINSVFSHNEGGGLFLLNYNQVVFSQVVIQNVGADLDGGFFYADTDNQVQIIACQFQDISTSSKGGLFFAEKVNLILVNNCSFLGMKAYDGGVFNLNSQNTLEVVNVSVQLALVTSEGGVVFAFLANKIQITGLVASEITSNSAGVIYLDNSNTLTINNSNFSNIIIISTAAIIGSLLENSATFFHISMSGLTLQSQGGGGAVVFSLGRNTNFWLNSSIISDIYAQTHCSLIMLDNKNRVWINTLQTILGANSSMVNTFLTSNSNNSISIEMLDYQSEMTSPGFIFLSLSQNSSLILKNSSFEVFTMGAFVVLALNSVGNLSNISFNEQQFAETLVFLSLNSRSFVFLEEFRLDMLFPMTFNIDSSVFKMRKVEIRIKVPDGLVSIFLQGKASQISFNLCKFKTDSQIFQFASLQTTIISISKSAFFGFGSVFYGSEMSSFQISSCEISTVKGNAIAVSNTLGGNFLISRIVVFENKFSSFSIVSMLPGNGQLMVKRSRFLLNIEVQGSAFSLSNIQNISFFFSEFSKNRAVGNRYSVGKGGALFINYHFNTSEMSINITSSIFQSNKAEIGACIYFLITAPFSFYQQNVTLRDNQASRYGPEFASVVHRIGFIHEDFNLDSSLVLTSIQLNVTSGYQYDSCLTLLVGFDIFNNLAYQDMDYFYENTLGINILSANFNENSISFSRSNGFICFNGPFNRLGLPIQGSWTYTIKAIYPSDVINTVNLTLQFGNCLVGEKLTSGFECQPCPTNRYSLEKEFKTVNDICYSCPNVQFQCLGGTNLIPYPGYWRFNSQSINFMACPNPVNCLGGILKLSSYEQKHGEYSRIFNESSVVGDTITSLQGFCLLGYSGVLCNECDYGYGKTGTTCRICQSTGYAVWVFFQLILKLGLFFYSLHVSMDSGVKEFMKEKLFKDIMSTNFLKILMNYMQILNLVFGYVDFKNIALLSAVSFTLGAQPNVGEAFNIECFLKANSINLRPLIFQFYFSLFYWIPIFIICSLYLVYLRKRSQKVFFMKPMIDDLEYADMMKAATLIILFICYFDIMSICLKLFPCLDVGDSIDSESRLLFDYSIPCYDIEMVNIRVVSLIIITVFGFGYPIFISYSIYMKFRRRKLFSSQTLLLYSYFFRAYEPQFFFWDILNLFRKLSALCIQILWASNAQINNTIALQVLLIMLLTFLLLQIKMRPFLKSHLDLVNEVEQASLTALSLTVYLVMLYKSLLLDQIENDNSTLILLLLALALAVNVAFVGFWLYKYLPTQKKQLVDGLRSLKDKITILMKKKETVEIRRKRRLAGTTEQQQKNIPSTIINPELLSSVGMQTAFNRNFLFQRLKAIQPSEMELDLQEDSSEIAVQLSDEYFSNMLLTKNLQMFHQDPDKLVSPEAADLDYTHITMNNSYFGQSFFQTNKRVLYLNPDFQVGIEVYEYEHASKLMVKYHLKLVKINPLFKVLEATFDCTNIRIVSNPNFEKRKNNDHRHLEFFASYTCFGRFPLPELIIKADVETNFTNETKVFNIPLPINLYSFIHFENFDLSTIKKKWLAATIIKTLELQSVNEKIIRSLEDLKKIFKRACCFGNEIMGGFNIYLLGKIIILYRIKAHLFVGEVVEKIKVLLAVEYIEKEEHILKKEQKFLDFVLQIVFNNLFGLFGWKDHPGEEERCRVSYGKLMAESNFIPSNRGSSV